MHVVHLNLGLTAGSDRKRDLIQIQWFVVIACCYLLVVQDDQFAQDALSLFLLAGPLTSILVFLRLPERVFCRPAFPQIMAALDTVLICTAIMVNRESPWDLVLIFFFGILIAAIGENFLQIIGGCLIVAILSVVLIPVSTGKAFSFDSNTLLRIPLLLGSSLVYGYLADQVKRERRKTADMEESRRLQLMHKDQFFSNVSHELRTPLTAVYQFVTLVLDGLAGELNAEQKEYLNVALRNVKQLQAMVGDLLEAARAESGKLAIHPRAVSLSLSVQEAVGTFSANARQKGIDLTQEVPSGLPLLYVDPRRLKQIFTNLIDNALKFTPKEGRVTVKAGICSEDPEFVQVSVVDTGCGIDPTDVDRIFNRLYQVENSLDTNRNGLGLGLHITKELVVRHGGRIWAEGAPGVGTSFHAILPIFSLRRLLQSLLAEEGQPIRSLSLISIELIHASHIALDVAKAIQDMAWLTLNAIELPQRTALFPNVVLSGEHGLFFIVQAKDLESSAELAERVKKELAGGKQLRSAKSQVRAKVEQIEVASSEHIEIDALARRIETQIARAVAQAKS